MKISSLHISKEGRCLIIYECLTDEGPQEGINHLESGIRDTRRDETMEIGVIPKGKRAFFQDENALYTLEK